MNDRADLKTYLAELAGDVEAALERVLRSFSSAPAVIAEPVRYSLLGPGKRLRPCLTLAVAETVGPPLGYHEPFVRPLALPAACAVEMIHSYSLVHDDLPAMDDDAMRRGRPTTHVVYGDGMAVLAGDALLTEAFRILVEWPSPAAPDAFGPGPSAEHRARAVVTLAGAAGVAGMVGGQAIDLASVGAGATLDATALEDMHLRKTGALIRASCTLGAIVLGAHEPAVHAVDTYARDLGLAFQIVDDVLDVEGSNADLGKTAGKDAAAGKPTFPAIYGVAGSRQLAAQCVERANAALATAGLSGRLTEIAEWSLQRQR